MKRNKIAILPQINNCGGDLSKKWFIYYSFRDPRNGSMKRFKVYNGLHKLKNYKLRMLAAEKLCSELKEKLHNGWNPFLDDSEAIYEDQLQYNNVAKIYGKRRASNKTVRFYASEFVNRLIKDNTLEEATISTYTSKLRTFSIWLDKTDLGTNDISCINNDDILRFFDFLINQRQLSANSIKKYKQILSALFDFARKEKAVNFNPVYDIPKCNRVNDQAPRPVADFDIMPFKEVIQKEDPQLWLAIMFEYYCFLRPGKELRLLKIGDIDFARGIINVDRFRSKTNLERFPTVPTVFLKQMREDYKLHTYPRHYYVIGKNYEPGDAYVSKNNLRTRFRNFREKLNMPESYKFYSWKHTGNSRALDADISIEDLRNQNGHTSTKTTEIYSRNKIGKVSTQIRDNFPPI